MNEREQRGLELRIEKLEDEFLPWLKQQGDRPLQPDLEANWCCCCPIFNFLHEKISRPRISSVSLDYMWFGFESIPVPDWCFTAIDIIDSHWAGPSSRKSATYADFVPIYEEALANPLVPDPSYEKAPDH